jgi:carbon monoxide dehydrogenase subunit G
VLINSDFEVPAPVDKVWDYLLDVPRMAPNLPGTELTDVIDEDNYKGRVTIKMGPVSMRFAGDVEIVERDEAARRAVINAAGADERGRGQASMVLTATLAKAGSGTKVRIAQDLQVSGAAAQYGRGMITDVTNVLVAQFSRNAAEDIPRWLRGEDRAAGGAASASGVSIGITAAITALKRVFWRFFGSYERHRALAGRR